MSPGEIAQFGLKVADRSLIRWLARKAKIEQRREHEVVVTESQRSVSGAAQ